MTLSPEELGFLLAEDLVEVDDATDCSSWLSSAAAKSVEEEHAQKTEKTAKIDDNAM